LLFNLYTHLISSVVSHSQLYSYADYHTLLKVIPSKASRVQAICELNSDLAALVQYGADWFIEFAPLKTKSLLVSLKVDKHDLPPRFLNGIHTIPEDSIKILGFVFDSAMTWKPHIDMIVSKSKSRMSQLYRLCQFLDVDGLSLMYKALINSSVLVWSMVIYCSTEQLILIFVDWILSNVVLRVCAPPLSLHYLPRRQAAAFGLICKLLDGEGRGILQSFCPHFATYNTRRPSCLSASNDPARDYRLAVPGLWTDFCAAGMCLLFGLGTPYLLPC